MSGVFGRFFELERLFWVDALAITLLVYILDLCMAVD
jgi:hypothetical protein